MKLNLYSGKDCHLCELALAMISQNQPQVFNELAKIDIKSDPVLYHQYAVRIPVLERLDTQQKLFWPFDEQQLQAFLQ